jgi:hypothetical protein
MNRLAAQRRIFQMSKAWNQELEQELDNLERPQAKHQENPEKVEVDVWLTAEQKVHEENI